MNGNVNIPLHELDRMREEIDRLYKENQELKKNEKSISITITVKDMSFYRNFLNDKEDYMYVRHIQNLDEFQDFICKEFESNIGHLTEKSNNLLKSYNELEKKYNEKKFKGFLSFLNKYLPQ